MTRLINGVFNGLLLMSVFWQVNGDNKMDVRNMLGSLFMLLTNILANTIFGTMQTFQFERPVFLREQANQMYSFVPYFLTKNVVEQPLIFLQPLITLLVVYWAVGYYQTFECFAKMYLTLVCFS